MQALIKWIAKQCDRAILARIDTLEASVEAAFKDAKPIEKQRFYGWIQDRSAGDEHALAYAEKIFEGQRRQIEKHRGPLAGLRILELGPGHTLVAGLLMYVHGARCYMGADLFPIAGKDAALYKRLRAKLDQGPQLFPIAPSVRTEALRRFDEAVSLQGESAQFDASKVECRYPVDAAKLPFADGSFDVVLSNAAFEHFFDPVAAVNECTRVLAPGGVGLHQIDLRDHRDFKNPLDFLCVEDDAWRKLHTDMFCYTNRFRKSDFERVFAESGVKLASIDVNMKAPVDPALRARFLPRWKDRTQEDLEALSAFFVVKKPELAHVS